MTEHKIQISDKVNISDNLHIEKIVVVDNENNKISGTMNGVIQLEGNIQGHVGNPIDISHLSPAGNSTLVNFLTSIGAIIVGGTVLQIEEIMLEGVTREDFLKWIKIFIKLMEYKN
jgi:hypothetical protein